MSKIIIHNKTDKFDITAMEYVYLCYRRIKNYEYFEFADGTRVQFIQQKTCKTFYVYGGNEVDK